MAYFAEYNNEVNAMKKYMLIFLIFLTACSKPQTNTASLDSVFEEIKNAAAFDNGITEDITEQKTADKYGISPSSIAEGYVYYPKAGNVPDIVIIAKASSNDSIEDIEKALSAIVAGKKEVWKDNEKERVKTENYIICTIGDCTLLSIGENAEATDLIFHKLKA